MIKLNSRALLCIILSALISQTGQMMAASSAMAQAPEDDIGKLFEDEGDFEEPPGVMNQVPPPPPPPPSDFGGGNPSAGFPPEPPANDFGGGSGGGGSSFPASGGSGGKVTTKVTPKGKKGNAPPLATAGIEDITDENYPDLIESFDYPNAEITDIIKAIGQLTGKNFIIDPGVHGKISIIAPTQISVAEAYKAFLSALAINGFTVVQSGKFLKVKNARNAQRDSIETYSGKYYPNADVMITRIVHLKYTSAEEVNKRLRILPSKDGDMTPYEPTNSLIISDYGTNVERMMKIINEIDRPGFEEQLAVIPIRHAKSKDLAELINQIINKETTRGGGGVGGGFGGPAPSFGAGVPRFRSRGGSGTGGAEELSLVAPDDRTNAIIVVGNATGIQKVRDLVKKLDYKLDPAEAGGVFVYYVRYGEAEKIEATLNGLAGGSGANQSAPGGGGGFGGGFGAPIRSPLGQQQIFGGDVKIKADKNTNSLVITASKQDYETVLNILSKLDIRKDQVFVEAIIMEMNNQKKNQWTPTYYKILPGTNGIARSGFNGGNLAGAASPASDSGAVLGFGTGDMVDVTIGGVATKVPSLLAFINLLQQNTESNILSTPHILALDNEDAEIEVGDQIPIAQESQTTGTTVSNTTRFDNASVKLKITPYIRPDSNVVRMKVDQSVKQPTQVNAVGATLAAATTSMSTRSIKTNITVQSGDTAVLGGLVRDSDSVQEKKVPILGDIPVLGWLFKSKTVETQKINLVVFLTPKILRTLEQTQQNVGKTINRRIDWMKKNFGGRDPYGTVIDSMPRAAQSDSEAEAGEPISSKSNRTMK